MSDQSDTKETVGGERGCWSSDDVSGMDGSGEKKEQIKENGGEGGQ